MGTLTYTAAPERHGTATVTVSVRDTGGLANGGVDVSTPETFTITITTVNDAPSDHRLRGTAVTQPREYVGVGQRHVPGS